MVRSAPDDFGKGVVVVAPPAPKPSSHTTSRHTFGSSEAAQILEDDLRNHSDPKLLPKVSRFISAQLKHLRSFSLIEWPKSRTYARQLWKDALLDALGQNHWPENFRTFALNVLTAHFRDSAIEASKWHMRKYKTEIVESSLLDDVLCDRCGESCKRKINYELANITADWGYESRKDCESADLDICENCFDELMEWIDAGRLRRGLPSRRESSSAD